MHRKFFIFTALLLLICSPALAEPRLWSVHNSYVTVGSTVGSDDYFKTDLSTAKFLNVDLEVVDDNTALLPDININDRESIPKLTISNGNYSYFTGSLIEEVSGASKTFEIARTDTLVHNEAGYKRTGYNTPGYTATNEEGDWVHFMFNADGGMNGATVTWPDYESLTGGSGTVPNFKTTKEQLDDIVPYIEYFGTQAEGYEEGWLAVEGFKWRFVKSSDVTKAVTTDVKITLQVIGSYNHADDCGEDETYYDGTGQQPIVIEAGQLLSGEVRFEKGNNDMLFYNMPNQTVLRYYKGDNKDECYQWRFIPNMYPHNTQDSKDSVQLGASYGFSVPLKNGKPDYKYTQYFGSGVGLVVYRTFTPEILAATGKATMTIGGGNYWLKNTDDEKIEDVSGSKTYTLFSRTSLLDSYFEFNYLVPGYRKVYFTYINDSYSTRGVNFMDEAGTLGGQSISWSFPGEADWISYSSTLHEYQGREELLASRYIPYVEAISKDNYITEIKYGFVESPDLDGSKFVTPEHFASMGINLIVWGEEGTSTLDFDTKNNDVIYNSHSFKLDNPIPFKAEYGYRIGVIVDIYPEVGPTWEDFSSWLGEGNSHLDANKAIGYNWIFDNLPSVSQMNRLGDDFDNVADNIADSLSEDVSEIMPVEREEMGDETGFMLDVINDIEQTESVDVIGRFKQLNVTESGTFAVKVTLPDELYDEIEGAASRDLVVYPITNSEISEPESESEAESESASASAARVSGGIKVSRPVRTSASNKSSGKLLASDGKTFNTIDKKEFILTVPLTKAEYEDYTNYGLYLGLKTASDTPAPAVPDIKSPDETPDTESQDTKPGIESPDNEPEVEDDSQYDYLNQNIDPAVKAAIMKLISTDYEIKTFIEAIKSNDITKYNNNVAVNKRHFETISGDLTNAELISVMPAFTFSANEHIVIIMKVSADLANQQELHLYTLKGAEVAGASLKFVRFSSNPDTNEDSGAMFFNSRGTAKIKTLTENIVYLAAEFSKGSYAPLVLTGTAKIEEPEKTYSDNILGSSSGGCNSGLFASGALMLLLLMFVKRK